MLMYSREDDLVGIQIHSRTQQPGPLWEHKPEGLQSSIVANMELEHWRLGLYLINPTLNCGGFKGDRIDSRGDR